MQQQDRRLVAATGCDAEASRSEREWQGSHAAQLGACRAATVCQWCHEQMKQLGTVAVPTGAGASRLSPRGNYADTPCHLANHKSWCMDAAPPARLLKHTQQPPPLVQGRCVGATWKPPLRPSSWFRMKDLPCRQSMESIMNNACRDPGWPHYIQRCITGTVARSPAALGRRPPLRPQGLGSA